ncbi:MAG: TauD/TfdA dioxygenase family protein [Alphaproteobacteria bacterium]
MDYKHIQVKPIAGALGAEIHGVDLARLDDETFAEIHHAFLENLVIFFRGQTITPDQQVAFSARFAPIGYYPFLKGLPDHPAVIEVRKEPEDKLNFGGVWHTDTAYLAKPPMGSVLYAKEIPENGGDTMFANLYLAYETLSGPMKAILDGRKAVNSSRKGDAAAGRQKSVDENPKDASDVQTESIHPVLRTHPETGRQALYVNRGHTVCFDGATPEESAPILEFLFEHQIRPEFTCRFQWAPGSIAVWDNRCALHYPLNDYHGQRRVMHRVTMEGGAPQ